MHANFSLFPQRHAHTDPVVTQSHLTWMELFSLPIGRALRLPRQYQRCWFLDIRHKGWHPAHSPSSVRASEHGLLSSLLKTVHFQFHLIFCMLAFGFFHQKKSCDFIKKGRSGLFFSTSRTSFVIIDRRPSTLLETFTQMSYPGSRHKWLRHPQSWRHFFF